MRTTALNKTDKTAEAALQKDGRRQGRCHGIVLFNRSIPPKTQGDRRAGDSDTQRMGLERTSKSRPHRKKTLIAVVELAMGPGRVETFFVPQ